MLLPSPYTYCRHMLDESVFGGEMKEKMYVCQPKKDVFTVYFNYDGFSSWPLKYCQGQMKELNDINFDKIAKLSLGVRELKSTQDIADMLKVGYDNGNEIDMYVEHFGYDIMELAELERNEEQNHNSIESSDDEYYSSDDYEEIENVDFQAEGDESVVIKNISTQDPFLNKLCSARIMFRGTAEHHETETPLVDPDENQIDSVNKVQSGVLDPAFDLDIPWDKMQRTLRMRYETPHQLKLALANYGVAHAPRAGRQSLLLGGKLSAGRQILQPGSWVLAGEIFLLNLSFKALVRVVLGRGSSYFTISSLQLDLRAWKLE
ncbi:hypothetical protein Tco_0259630 [Tanacetum coccineum]